MTWVKLDDRMWRNPKLKALSAKAFRVHIAGMCCCAEFSTDGYVSEETAAEVGAKGSVLIELLTPKVPGKSSLWVRHLDGGYMIHDYLEYNPSRDQIALDKAKRTDRARKGAEARWHASSNASSNAISTPLSIDSVDAPSPLREEPLTVQEDSTDEGTPLVLLRLLEAMGETEHSQAHLELMAFKARGASEADFRRATGAVRKKRLDAPRRYVATVLSNAIAERG